jgi:hypothetical protein
MILPFILIATVESISPQMSESINSIPYASDNFTDKEWQQFELCRDIMYDNLKRNQLEV